MEVGKQKLDLHFLALQEFLPGLGNTGISAHLGALAAA